MSRTSSRVELQLAGPVVVDELDGRGAADFVLGHVDREEHSGERNRARRHDGSASHGHESSVS